MRYSEWQLNRLRDALRAYHRFGRDAVDGRHYNWKDVSEAISLSTEVEVPPERLLIYDTPQGWQPLCDFLGVPVPDAPFPKTNSTEEFRNRQAARAAANK